jgi:phage gp46-like protein
MAQDLLIYESGNGGELKQRGNDFAMVQGIEYEPYLLLFGCDRDWWGNDFLDPTDTDKIWSSETEKTFNSVALNSAGRIKIEEAINKDLAPLRKQTGAAITVQVQVVADDRSEIFIDINSLRQQFIWSPDALYKNYKI